MKKHRLFGIVVVLIGLGLLAVVRQTTAQTQTTPRLIQISDREWADWSKVTIVRLPTFTVPDYPCPECQTRWGALIIVDGKEYQYTEKADPKIKELLGVR